MQNMKGAGDKQKLLPSVPASGIRASAPMETDVYTMRAPPPTYEESQRMRRAVPGAAPPSYGNNMPSYASPPLSNHFYGMTQHHQLPTVSYQHNMQSAATMMSVNSNAEAPTSAGGDSRTHVLNLDSRAEVRTTPSGSIVIPPPPPGCAPTAAQLAAMQGKSVVVVKPKRSFF